MIRRAIERLVASVAVVLGATSIIFFVLNWLPGDTAVLVAGEGADPALIDRLREQLGTDRPVLVRYWRYLGGLLHGDLGRSYATREPVLDQLIAHVPSSAALALSASTVAVTLGVLLGVLSANFRGRWVDQAIQGIGLLVASIPPFWLGLVGIVVFSVKLRWLPVLGDGGVLASVLPVGCMGLVGAIPLMRLVRTGVIDALEEPYVTTLRAKGLRRARILYVHVLRNVAMSAVTYLGVLVGELLSSLVVVETLFARPGLGRLAVQAVGVKDLPVVQGAILLTAGAYVFINLLVDLSYAWLDPRVRLGGEGRPA